MNPTVIFDPETGQASIVGVESTATFDPMGILGDGSKLSRTRGVAAGTAGYAEEGMIKLTLESYVARYNRLLEHFGGDPNDPNLPAEMQSLRNLIDRVEESSGLTDPLLQLAQQKNLGSVRREWFSYQEDLGISTEEMSAIFGEVISSILEDRMAIVPENFFELYLPNNPRFQELERILQGNLSGPEGSPGESRASEKTGVVESEKGPGNPGVYNPKDPSDPIIVEGGSKTPIILDLDGDGVEVAYGVDIYFDLDDDGFLVIDRDADGTRGAGDGVIDQSNELVLSSLGLEGDTDLQALARYDDNGDGKLDASDAIWNELKVWQDLNQDGKTEGDGTELKTLAAWGISSINLAYDDGTKCDDAVPSLMFTSKNRQGIGYA